MLCSNGIVAKPPNATCLYFLCQLEKNKNSSCRFAKWCSRLNTFEMATDRLGNACPDLKIE